MKKLLCLFVVMCMICTFVSFPWANAAEAEKNMPYIFNATETAMPGEVIGLQGYALGGKDTEIVVTSLANRKQVKLKPITKSDVYVAAVLPDDIKFSTYEVKVKTEVGTSAPVYINTPHPNTVQFDELSDGFYFRIFGKNLIYPGYTTTVIFEDESTGEKKEAAIDAEKSDPYILSVIAPNDLKVGNKYRILIDNGMGGEAVYVDDDSITAREGAADVFGLGAPWGANYVEISENVINVKTDERLKTKANANGKDADTAAIREAMALAESMGGGTVYLPEGTYVLDWSDGENGIDIGSGVVIKGDGVEKTTVNILGPATEYYAVALKDNAETTGLYNLTFNNINENIQHNMKTGKVNRELFIKNVNWNLGTGDTFNLEGITRLVVADCVFDAYGNTYLMMLTGGVSHIWIRGMEYTFSDGRIWCADGFGGYDYEPRIIEAGPTNHHYVFEDSRYTRDPSRQYVGAEAVEANGIEYSGAKDIAIINNTFDYLPGDIVKENDGETILTQYCNPEGMAMGTVTSAKGTVVTDEKKTFDDLGTHLIIAIVDGKGIGQWRNVTGSTDHEIHIDREWDVMPDETSNYVLTSWAISGGTTQGLVKGNYLGNSRRGIWIYGSASDLTVVDNELVDCESIWVRASHYDNGRYNLNWNIYVGDNVLTDTRGIYPAYIGVHVPIVANAYSTGNDVWGTGILGTEVRRNTVNGYTKGADPDNKISQGMIMEGYACNLRWGHDYGTSDAKSKVILGTIFDRNTANNVNAAFTTSSGVYQTVIYNTRYIDVKKKLDDQIQVSINGATGTEMVDWDGKSEKIFSPLYGTEDGNAKGWTYKEQTVEEYEALHPVEVVTFDDIVGHWAKEDVEYCATKGIIKGVSDTEFAPENQITRAEFLALAVRTLGLTEKEYADAYTDVSKDAWYAKSVQTAKDANLIDDGMIENGAFKPEDPINREEMTSFIVKAYEYKTGKKVEGDLSKFADADKISGWASGYVASATGLGIINGVSDTEFAPKDYATRAQAAAMFHRLLLKF